MCVWQHTFPERKVDGFPLWPTTCSIRIDVPLNNTVYPYKYSSSSYYMVSGILTTVYRLEYSSKYNAYVHKNIVFPFRLHLICSAMVNM